MIICTEDLCYANFYKEADKMTNSSYKDWMPWIIPLSNTITQTFVFDYQKYQIGFSKNYTFSQINPSENWQEMTLNLRSQK